MAEVALDQERETAVGHKLPRCRDFDEDCAEIENKVHCWLYDPEKGFCPWLAETSDL